jgi:hypothetical protein
MLAQDAENEQLAGLGPADLRHQSRDTICPLSAQTQSRLLEAREHLVVNRRSREPR